jgi:HlyD family secretion protein
MHTEISIENQPIKKKFKPSKWIIIALIVAFVVIAGFWGRKLISKKNDFFEHRTAMVERGDIIKSLNVSGSITASNRRKVTSTVEGKILKLMYNVGDSVKEGDILAEIDNTEGLKKIQTLQDDIKKNYEKKQLKLSEVGKLDIVAPMDGYVSELNVKNGDSLSTGGTLLTLIDDSILTAQIRFNGNVKDELNVGDKVEVYVASLMDTVSGYVTYVNNRTSLLPDGTLVCNAEINLKNPGVLSEGMLVSVQTDLPWGRIVSIGSSKLEYSQREIIKTEVSGTITKTIVKEGSFVKKGDLLVTMKNDDLIKEIKEINDKTDELNNQLEKEGDILNNYSIRSPIDGTIIKSDFVIGSMISNGTELFEIINNRDMQLTVSLDELDVTYIKVGQEAFISLDAVPQTIENPIKGEVSSIAFESTGEYGITLFPVVIKIIADSEAIGVKSGMNANAKILIENKKNILKLPIDSVQREGGTYYVMIHASEENAIKNNTVEDSIDIEPVKVKDYSEEENFAFREQEDMNLIETFGGLLPQLAEYYKGAAKKLVQVGIQSKEHIEIISGLKEGDVVILPPLFIEDNNTSEGFYEEDPYYGYEEKW